jgi:putative flippase GtrA
MSLQRQFVAYALVGAVATFFHYCLLGALVELVGWRPVPAALAGYALGGVISYVLNRRHVFDSDRPHQEAGWRFALVASLGFFCTYAMMALFVERLGAPYFAAQAITTVAVMFLSFPLNRLWTFGDARA